MEKEILQMYKKKTHNTFQSMEKESFINVSLFFSEILPSPN